MRRLVAGLLALVAGLFAATMLAAAPASAHARQVSSDPGDGARLRSAPSSVSVTFDEGVFIDKLSYFDVLDSKGRRVDTGPLTHPGGRTAVISVALKPGLGDGTYTESYRVTSDDSHPVAGVIRFVVGNGPLVVTGGVGGGSDHGVATLFDVTRWISYAGIALLGGAWLMLTVFPGGRDDRRARRLVWAGWGAAVIGALLELCLQGAYIAGRPVSSAFDSAVIDATLHSAYGTLHSWRFALLGAVALVLGLALQPGRRRTPLDHAFWPLGLGIAYTFSAAGHAETTHPVWLSVAFDMLHLTAMAGWLGGLVLLVGAVLPRRSADEYARVLPVFSRVAFGCVAVLAVTGTYAAWHGVGSWRALVHTEYGLLVLGKIVLFVGLLALGNLSRVMINRRVLRPAVAFAIEDARLDPSDELSDGSGAADPATGAVAGLDPVRAERMRRSVIVEIAVSLVVLALTAVLVTQPRGAEALAAQVPAQASATAPIDQRTSVTVTVTPGAHGPVTVTVRVQGGAVTNVAATATQPQAEIGPLPLKLRRTAPGVFRATGVTLPVSGEWSIQLVVISPRAGAVTTDVSVRLA